jgi:hypothetical protein
MNKNIINIDTDKSIDEINNKKKNKPNKLSESKYDRPILTFTDKLSKKEIESLLLDYEQVDKLDNIPIGTHIRYFEKKDGELKFRTGGILAIKTGLPEYCILKNGKLSWSVQTKTSIFFRRITIKEVKKEYETKLIQKENELNELRSLIRILKKKLKKYED